MKGRIKTFLPEKKYGFIAGDDGKDYFFHANDVNNATDLKAICDEALVEFEQQATPKGYRARSCKLISPEQVDRFVVPDNVMLSRHSNAHRWEVLEASDWVLHGSSRDSPDAARREVKQAASRIGANAVIELEYYKTTGSEAGTGRGTHHFTIHNFRGRAVMLGQRNSLGRWGISDLIGLNARASNAKREANKRTAEANNTKWMLRILAVSSSLGCLFISEVLAILPLLFLFVIGLNVDYSSWLEYSPIPSNSRAPVAGDVDRHLSRRRRRTPWAGRAKLGRKRA